MQEGGYRKIILTQPVGYQTSISLVNHAKKIVTDSGGLQREAFFAQKPCVTVFDYVGWPETMRNNCNQLAKPDKADILAKLSVPVTFDPAYQPSGTATAPKNRREDQGVSAMIKVCHMTSAHGEEDVRIFHKECVSLAKAGYDTYLVERGESREKTASISSAWGRSPKAAASA